MTATGRTGNKHTTAQVEGEDRPRRELLPAKAEPARRWQFALDGWFRTNNDHEFVLA